MRGDDRITSRRVLRRCVQLEILRRRCSIRSSNEKCTGSGLWPVLPLPVSGLDSSFFIVNLHEHGQGQTGFSRDARLAPRGSPVAPLRRVAHRDALGYTQVDLPWITSCSSRRSAEPPRRWFRESW